MLAPTKRYTSATQTIWRAAVEGLSDEPGAETGSVEAVMITLQADFNHTDARGRLRLADLRTHQDTPFAEIAAKHETIIFVDGDDMVRGELVHDPEHGWIGQVDWSTQDVGS